MSSRIDATTVLTTTTYNITTITTTTPLLGTHVHRLKSRYHSININSNAGKTKD